MRPKMPAPTGLSNGTRTVSPRDYAARAGADAGELVDRSWFARDEPQNSEVVKPGKRKA
jgi:hypothetical protein